MKRLRTLVLAVAVGSGVVGVAGAEAKGGSDLLVTTTATVSGSVIQGVVTIANGSSKALAITGVSDVLEVRYPSGYPVPALPPGSTSGYYVVATRALTAPASVPALATITIPYRIDVCVGPMASYQGAKDMRNAAFVVAGSQNGAARSASFVPPAQSACPVCGNRIREGNEQCDGGSCCTASCTFAANGASCSDGNACTTTDSCQGGACRGASPIVCAAFDQCHDAGACNPLTGTCTNPARANGAVCEDGSACTLNDSCQGGRCAGTPMPCDDGNVCTTDSCAAGACRHQPNEESCEDGSVCTDGDACIDGLCVGGAPRECDDLRSCTQDACTEDRACTHEPTAVCVGCAQDQCLLCRDQCTLDRTACENQCWAGFLGCLDGCTSTYCAPFCQADLGPCFTACPAEADCAVSCDTGNGCAAGCSEP